MSYWKHDDEIFWSKFEKYCSECGKIHNYNKIYRYWFDTIDGGDYADTTVCWKCELERRLREYTIYPIKKYLKYLREKNKLTKMFKGASIKNDMSIKEQKIWMKNYIKKEVRRYATTNKY